MDLLKYLVLPPTANALLILAGLGLIWFRWKKWVAASYLQEA